MKQTVHIVDTLDEQAYTDRDPFRIATAELGGARTLLNVPMLKEGKLIGAIGVYRQEVQPFTDKQIELVTNFAAQAVIAIENARLLSELRQRTDDLSESLEQQTATSEVLKVISSSNGELQPVFQSVLENATRLCAAKFGNLYLCEGDAFRTTAMHNVPAEFAEMRKRDPLVRPGPGSILGRLAMSKMAIHSPDVKSEQGYIERNPLFVSAVELGGFRAMLAVPMLKDGILVGAILIYRQEVGAFSDKQVDLVTNFAAQAVIAIENARLLNELRETLERQTATSEVLRVISSSPGELEPVFDSMLENAVRICQARFGVMHRFYGEEFAAVATLNVPQELDDFLRQRGRRRAIPGSDMDILYKSKQVVHTFDMLEFGGSQPAGQARRGANTTCRAHAHGQRIGRRHRHLSPGSAPVHR